MKIRIIMAVLLNFWLIQTCTAANLSSDRTDYIPGTALKVNYAPHQFKTKKPWIGIFKKTAPRNATTGYISYVYITSNAKQAKLIAPSVTGNYQLRLIDDNPAVVIARSNFTVTPADASQASLKLDKTVFSPESSMTVYFTSPAHLPKKAWVGIFKVNAHNSSYKSYRYLNAKTKGTLSLRIPADTGSYELRMFDVEYNGRIIAKLPFKVAINSNATIAVESVDLAPASTFTVKFTAPDTYAKTAWIGLVKKPCKMSKSDSASQYITYRYLKKRTSGEIALVAPAKAGTYYVCIHASDYSVAVASIKVKVTHSINAKSIKKTLSKQGRVNVYGIYFDTDSDAIKPGSHFVLNEIAKLITSDKRMQLQIVGHTDNQGDDNYNLNLSKRRAAAVATYLVNKHGIDKKRLTTSGEGEIKPVSSNANAHGRSLNRRVELIR